ncbi:MAG: hypothetical protein D6694_12545, partial [Gammaproteobacteria bacterium]
AGWQVCVRAVAAPWGAPFACRGLGARRPVGHSEGRRVGRHAQQCVQRTAATPRANRGANCKVWYGLAVVVVQTTPLPLTLTLGKIR